MRHIYVRYSYMINDAIYLDKWLHCNHYIICAQVQNVKELLPLYE